MVRELDLELPNPSARTGWWAFVLVLGLAAAFLAYSFVGLLMIGVFGYYATRPIYNRLDDAIDSDGVAAGITISLVIVPIVLLALYAGFQVFQQVQQLVGGAAGPAAVVQSYLNVGPLSNAQQAAITSIVQNPRRLLTNPQQTIGTFLQTGLRVVSAIVGGLLLIALGVTLSYFLLENQEQLSDGLIELFGGRDTVAYAYAAAIDEDLESVFFGNFLFVVVMSVIATAVYWGTNYLAPPGLIVPMIFVLGFLTGVASLVPIVVGKVIYVPIVAYLGWQATQAGGAALVFVGGTLVVYFLALDILPQTFLQPYITGRRLDMVMMMFAYLLGPILFGWYGFFLLPIVFIVMLEALRIVVPELLHGEALTPDISMGGDIGTDPESAVDEPVNEEETTAGDTD